MGKHTPGPWAIRRGHSTVEITTTAGLSVAQTTSDRYWQGFREEALANARVLAAAPDMLEALKVTMQHGRIDDSEARMNLVAAAIAKAEGRV